MPVAPQQQPCSVCLVPLSSFSYHSYKNTTQTTDITINSKRNSLFLISGNPPTDSLQSVNVDLIFEDVCNIRQNDVSATG